MTDIQANVRAMQAKFETDIAKYGQTIVAVGGLPQFFYTIGNMRRPFYLPELLMIAPIDFEAAAQILNILGEEMRGTRAPLIEPYSFGGKFPVKFRQCSKRAREQFTFQASFYAERHRFQSDYPVTQVLICDTKGRYPGDSGCDHIFDVELP